MTAYNFEVKTYNGVEIIINTIDGYVNASQMCSSNNKQWRHYKNTKSWKSVKNAFERRYSEGGIIRPPSYFLEKVAPKYQGEYIHPKLVHFVAEYCSVDYAFIVAEIMDSINDKVHEVLNEKQLPDTVENAKPVFVDVAKQIAPSIQTQTLENQCWGYRDKVYELDQWEQDDLRRCINDYKEIKEKLIEQEQKLSEWGRFVDTYFPEFNK
ncbi:hypothetical protein M9Y10_044514 [Tritrichomonas musculus]|uniref:KilA-N domain-containing protein n=1 Tax=Tritrichomonas musculus TaxID=1915356 RepID=A0ABR2JTC7_9EUKA